MRRPQNHKKMQDQVDKITAPCSSADPVSAAFSMMRPPPHEERDKAKGSDALWYANHQYVQRVSTAAIFQGTYMITCLGALTSRSMRVEVLNPLAIKNITGMYRRRGSNPPLLCDPGWVV